jgi:hypothetical protein
MLQNDTPNRVSTKRIKIRSDLACAWWVGSGDRGGPDVKNVLVESPELRRNVPHLFWAGRVPEIARDWRERLVITCPR